MNPSNDYGSNFLQSSVDQRQHHCFAVDVNNNCACVTNDDHIGTEGDELIILSSRQDHQLVESIDQLPLLVRSALVRRRRRKSKGLARVTFTKQVVTIEQLISRIEAVSRLQPTTAPPSRVQRRFKVAG